jgi:hypothetical protein
MERQASGDGNRDESGRFLVVGSSREDNLFVILLCDCMESVARF